WVYFDELLINSRYLIPRYFPNSDTINRVISLSGIGHDIFIVLMSDCITELKTANSANGGSQCFPLYTYSTDGKTRYDNISDYALSEARQLYGESVTREDIFYATYAMLHHPAYRAKYAENLKREL